MRMSSLELPGWLAPVVPAEPGRLSLSRTLRVVYLVMIGGALAASSHSNPKFDQIGLWILALGLCAALAINHRGHPESAANFGLLLILLFSASMAWVASDGFRSINFYLLVCLLMIAAVMLRPIPYCAFAVLVMAIVAAVGWKEMLFVAHGGQMHRTPTSYDTIFDVECIFGTSAVAGGLLVRNMHRSLRQIGETSRALSDANIALQSSENRLRSLIEFAADAIYITDPSGRIIDANRRACALGGLSKDRLLGVAITEIFPRERPGAQTIPLERFRNGAEAAFGAEMKRMDGSTIAVELAAKPMPDGAIQVICRDITDRLRSEEQILHMQKLESIGRLAGGVAHDFNNLLTVINGYSSLLLRDADEGAASRGRLLQISKAGARAAELTQQLLAFSRKQVVQTRPLNLNHEIVESEKMLRRLLSEDIELTTVLDPALGLVVMDAGQMHQVLMNLAVNARDAMPKGGQLRIETRNVELKGTRELPDDMSPGRYVHLTVADTGIGMDEATRAQIFEPFFTTKPKGSGTGLGLSMVYGIVRQSQGWISVESGPGRGSTFQIYLPLADATASYAAEIDVAPGLSGSETILVVEDQEDVRDFACGVLRALGYQVLDAADGAQAIRVAQNATEPIHLLLSDVIMPGMTGKDVAERLQAHNPRMKVLFMSGYTDDVVVHRGVLRDGVSYVAKPFSPDELAGKVRKALDGA
jgi:PAS domain S-box-containing protein